mmetsp:Transcript_32365/g.70947  ORF Transcript_32365/g.70947 Transcript_32365/m.70947 type:complete len:211 (+) Transcript_32365:981-1613(+)
MSRFMATHMMWVRMAPEEPMSAPTVVSSGFSSMKPSAHSAQPEYELRTVITTGMSAPPMEAVMCQPRPPESTLMPASAATLVIGVGFATKRPKQPSIDAAVTALIISRCGSASGAEPRLPLSLPNATSEPVAVTPPIIVARPTELMRTASSISGACRTCSRKSALAANTAARPTSEWKAATVCGREVGSTRLAIAYPAAPPPPSAAASCT